MNDSGLKMDVITAIQGGRSVRSYTPGKLDKDDVQSLLEAAVRAPTALHEEPWAFVVLQDVGILKWLSDRWKASLTEEVIQMYANSDDKFSERFTDPDFNIFYNAGTLIVICAKPGGKFIAADCWLAAENLMLAAHAMGLGTCVIGSAASVLNTPETKTELGIPGEFIVHAPIIVGVPNEDSVPASRKEPQVLVWK